MIPNSESSTDRHHSTCKLWFSQIFWYWIVGPHNYLMIMKIWSKTSCCVHKGKGFFSTNWYIVSKFCRALLIKYISFCSGYSWIKDAPMTSC